MRFDWPSVRCWLYRCREAQGIRAQAQGLARWVGASGTAGDQGEPGTARGAARGARGWQPAAARDVQGGTGCGSGGGDARADPDRASQYPAHTSALAGRGQGRGDARARSAGLSDLRGAQRQRRRWRMGRRGRSRRGRLPDSRPRLRLAAHSASPEGRSPQRSSMRYSVLRSIPRMRAVAALLLFMPSSTRAT
jgi:hypothetical protein